MNYLQKIGKNNPIKKVEEGELKMKQKMTKKGYKKENLGITLVALVVTIVVLLILAGITITMLVGDNGIISQAKKAQNLTEQDEANTQKGLQNLIDELNKYYSDNPGEETVDFATILADLEANPNNYLAQAQALGQTTDTNIGIGTDGKVVNLDLWYYVKTDDGTGVSLGNTDGCDNNWGYHPENITADGKIQGTVPQHIYYVSENTIYPVTSMRGTFTYDWFNELDNCYLLKYAPKLPLTLKEMENTFMNNCNLISAPSIPSSVTNMYGTFWNCTSLTTAPTIPSSVTNMYGTFWDCTSLTTAPTIPSSVTNIDNTFRWCTSLTTVPTIPSSVTNMYGTFYGCTALTTAPTIPSSVTNMSSTFMECTSLTTVPTIPSSVTDMGSTFQNCTSLTTAPTIPLGVTNMNWTFYGCTGLTTAPTIPSSVTNMEKTFKNCTKLQGDLVINANPTSYTECLYNAGKDATSKLYLSGSSTKLNELLKTKGSSTNIEIK